MANEIVIVAPQSLDESERLSLSLAKSALLPDALRAKPADILATVLAGAELGLAPMQSLRGIVIIKGKPTLSADTMGALVKRRGDVCEYLVLKESTAARAVYETKRKGDPAPTVMAFSAEDATRAGLNGDNWRKYPSAMLRARALSAICRAVYPDLCLGLYDPDELREDAPGQPQPPPSERDVTPPANGAGPTKTAQVKAALQAKAQTVEASKPTPHKMPIVEVAPGETEEQAKARAKPPSVNGEALEVRKRIKVALEKRDLRGQPALDFVQRITGRAVGHDADDLARIQAALEAEFAQPPPDSEPPPPGDEEAPF